MDLKALENANFALKSLIDDKPIEKFVFNDALVGIADFLKSEMNEAEKRYIDQNIDVFMGVSNILRINYEGRSCIKEIIEVNYTDFIKIVDHLNK